MTIYNFYKYRKINEHLLNSLRMSQIYFSPQKELNDPFDCELDIVKAINNAIDISSDAESKKLGALLQNDSLFDNFQDNVDQLGICSFSKEMNESQTLPWSHYADNHKGVCLLYEMPESFLDDEDNILGVSEVTYVPNSLTEWFTELAKRLPVTKKELITKLLIRILTAKSPPWRYEGEARIIRPEHGAFNIDKSFLRQICFGLHATDEGIQNVRDEIKYYKPKVCLYRATRGSEDFGIEYQEI